MAEGYPLDWPDGWPRARFRGDGRGRFASGTGLSRQPVTLSKAATSLYEELERMGASDVVVSSNLQRRLDGGILANQSRVSDPGIAVYFVWKKRPYVMARDAFDRAEDNLRSLALALAGMRQVERHGGSKMVEKAFAGFTALPPPVGESVMPMSGPDRPSRKWFEVLGVAEDAPEAVVKGAHRGLVKEAGGASTEINAAMADFRRSRGAS